MSGIQLAVKTQSQEAVSLPPAGHVQPRHVCCAARPAEHVYVVASAPRLPVVFSTTVLSHDYYYRLDWRWAVVSYG